MAQEVNISIDLVNDIRDLNTSFSDTIDTFLDELNKKYDMFSKQDFKFLLEPYYDLIGKTLVEISATASKKIKIIEKSLNEIYKIKNNDETASAPLKHIVVFYDLKDEVSLGIKKFTDEFKKSSIKKIRTTLKKYNHNVTSKFANVLSELESLYSEFKDYDWSSDKSLVRKQFSKLNKNLTIIKEQFSANKNDIENSFGELGDTIFNRDIDRLYNLHEEKEVGPEKNKSQEQISESTVPVETNLHEALFEVKEIVADKIANTSGKEILSKIKKYFSRDKETVKSNDNEKIFDRFEDIEAILEKHLENNNNKVELILNKLDDCEKSAINKKDFNEDKKSFIEEILSLKDITQELGNAFKDANIENNNISKFISDKILELSSNILDLADYVQSGFQQGFAYNAELIEEKTSALLEVIKDLRHASTENIKLFEILTVTDSKLMDVKQELELLSTDVIGSMNAVSSSILKNLEEVKSYLKEISLPQINEDIQSVLSEIRSHLQDKKQDGENNFDEIYNEISNKLEENKNNIRDFVLSDIDSVIIKVDNIKDYLTDKLDSIVPPNPQEMEELNKFVSQISDFKKQNEELLKEFSSSINDNIDAKHDEIKSILTVALNNNEIIKAIKELKKCFKSRINDFKESEMQVSDDGDEPVIVEEDNIFAENQDIINDLKYDFDRISSQIENLSGQNTDIEYILNNIGEKIDNIRVENDFEDKKLLGDNDFDFIKAFDLLTSDIKHLKASVSKILQDSDKKYSLTAETLYTKFNDNIEKHLASAKNEWLEEIKNYISDDELKTLVREVNDKIDILALTSNSNDSDNSEIKKLLDTLNAKVDVLALGSDYRETEEISFLIDNLNDKIERLFSQETGNVIEDVKQSIDSLGLDSINYNQELKNIIETLNAKIDVLAESGMPDSNLESDLKITSMLETLNHKIDILAESGLDNANEENFEDIKQLIIAQKDYIEKLEPSEKLNAFKKCLDELSLNINSLSGEKNDEIHKTLKDMKESIMDAVVSIFSQVSFVEETEDIKDFVEEKTEKIARNLEEVTKQIKQMASSDEENDYNYSMQDIETDLAKLRIALNELQNNALGNKSGELTSIADTLNRITYAVDALSQDEIQGLKTDITNLKEQTRQLLLSSDASFTTLNNDIIYKVDNVTQMLEKAGDSDKVMRQALIYMGEWIDSASESMNKISSNSDEILNIKSTIEENFEQQQEQLSFVRKQISKLESLEEGFVQQEARIDRLEANLDKILSIVEDIDNSGLMRKVDKIEKQLNNLSSGIEKLVSYVD